MQNLPLIKGVKFINCKFTFCFFGPAIFENIKFEDYGRLNSPFFRRTKFKGKFSSFGINSCGFLTDKNPQIQEQIDEFRRGFYSSGEWALDISEAKFSEFGCEGIDADLFVRDATTQFIVRREIFYSLEQLSAEFKEKFWRVADKLENFINFGEKDAVLAVPLARPKSYREPVLQGLCELKRLGLAE